MRKYLIALSLTAFMAPQAALACPLLSNSSITVNCENGVSVYRGTPLRAPVIIRPAVDRSSVQALTAQQALINAQERRINTLEDNLDRESQSVTRRRSRNFSVPIGAFGRGVGSGFGGRIAPRLGSTLSFSRSGAAGRRRF